MLVKHWFFYGYFKILQKKIKLKITFLNSTTIGEKVYCQKKKQLNDWFLRFLRKIDKDNFLWDF